MHYVQRIHKKANKEMVMLRTLVKINAYSHKMNIKHSAFRSERKEDDNYSHLKEKKEKKKLTHCCSENIFSPYFNIKIS
jgi:hypothetical protein